MLVIKGKFELEPHQSYEVEWLQGERKEKGHCHRNGASQCTTIVYKPISCNPPPPTLKKKINKFRKIPKI